MIYLVIVNVGRTLGPFRHKCMEELNLCTELYFAWADDAFISIEQEETIQHFFSV